MDINANFDERVLVHGAKLDWQKSPMPGVSRRMLDRMGDEVARATTIVRYEPGSQFSPHTHTGGEEFVVLEGIFQDEHGDYPPGSYIRNPPTSSHTPSSESGCVIFVKLWQFDLADRTHVRTHIDKIGSIAAPDRTGVSVTPLFEDTRETVRIERWEPEVNVTIDAPRGAECLVLAGDCHEGADRLDVYSWLRLPKGSSTNLTAGLSGTTLWMKSGHLQHVQRSFEP